MTKELIPLHVHSHYSLLDSMISVKDYVKWGKENSMPALALTEHGVLGSAIKFFTECINNNIKPILGEEFYMTLDKNGQENKTRDNYHLILLAKNKTGWLNLIKLHNLSYHDFYYKPRIKFEDLEKYSEGIIACSACMGGIIPKAIIEQDLNKIDLYIKIFKKIFKDDFYLELQEHNLPQQYPVNQILIQLSKNYNIKLIATNDSHYVGKDDVFAHQVLLCKQTHSKISNPSMKFDSSEFYLKNTQEMRHAFCYLDDNMFNEIINNTNEIADKVESYDILQHEYNYPKFGKPEESLQMLTKLTQEGFIKRFQGKNIDFPKYIQRLKYELETMYKIGFVDYFLLLDDLGKFLDKNNILKGFGRGSGGGSLVLYCLGITGLDPIKHNLLFERFINPDRISEPDYDLDTPDIYRQKVVEYLENKYGKNMVCSIATYGEMTSVASFKAVASVLEMPFNEANKISKDLLDTNLSLTDNLEHSPELQKLYNTNTLFQKVFETAKKLEGGIDKRGIHACACVISNQPLDNLTPLMHLEDANGNMVNCSSFEMGEISDKLKLLKLDVLGLKNLTIIQDCLNKINNSVDIHKLDFQDEETYKTISKGSTLGIFQMESDAMRKLCRDVKSKCLADLSAINAGVRPGASESGLTASYINRRNGTEEIDYVCDGMEEYLKETLGTFMYQEQVMQLSRVMAGYTMGQADGLRKIIGKKLKDKLPAERKRFIEGCIKNGHTEQRANEIFDMIEKFGRYGFNASHSYAYSALSYATAYLKTHYPLEYMTALLNANSDNLDKLNPYIDECYRMGINVLSPDINKSSNLFEHDSECNAIRFGFAGIKGVGTNSILPIIAERQNGDFKSLEDLLNRIPSINKTVVENLIKCGALNSIEKCPYKYLPMMEFSSKAKAKKVYKDGEKSYYDCLLNCYAEHLFKQTDKYKLLENDLKIIKGNTSKDKFEKDRIKKEIEYGILANLDYFKNMVVNAKVSAIKQNELEILGFPISCNPKKEMINLSKYIENTSLADIKSSRDYDTIFAFMGRIKSIKKTKNGSYFTVLTDDVDEITTFMKKDTYNKLSEKLSQPSNYFRIYGHLNMSKSDKYEDSFSLEGIRYFNVSTESKIILQYTGNNPHKLPNILTDIKESAIINLDDINYSLSIITGQSKYELSIDYWVEDLSSIGEIMIKNDLVYVK